MEQIYDMIVIGGGPAGYTAALYAARSGLSVVVLEKLFAGGQMALTEQIEPAPQASRTASMASLWRRRCKSRRSASGYAANTQKSSAWI